MQVFTPRITRLALCLAISALPASPALSAQDAPQQQGQGWQGRGQGGGMFGAGMNGTEGTVTAISGGEISLKNEQGEAYKVETGPNTRFRKDRDEARLADIRVGDVIMAAGNLDDQAKTVGAVFVVVLSPEQAARMEKMRADFGKTWTAGRVTAINGLTLTVERPDKVTQSIAVDENTTFHKRGEDITFPDIKVGDMVRATGAVQGSGFLAVSLMVMGGGRMGHFGQGETQGQGSGQGQPGSPSSQPQGASSGNPQAQPQN
jgi:hypothetical protein